MAMSGVDVDNDCKVVFDELQKNNKHRYIIYKIDGGKICIDKIGARTASYEDFLVDLKQKDGDNDDCRYGCYDLEFFVESQGTDSASFRSKIFLVLWGPDSAKVKKKMVYSSSFDSIKKVLVGVHKAFQANDDDDLEEKTVKKIFLDSARI